MNEVPESRNILQPLLGLPSGEFWSLVFYFLVAIVLVGRRIGRVPMTRLDLYLVACAGMLMLSGFAAWASSLMAVSTSHGVDMDTAFYGRLRFLQRLIPVYVFSVIVLAGTAFIPGRKGEV